MKLVKAVIERTYRFRRHRADGTPTDTIVAIRAESEEAARLKLAQNSDKPYDWRLIEVVED